MINFTLVLYFCGCSKIINPVSILAIAADWTGQVNPLLLL
jgi:hypothetical protein